MKIGAVGFGNRIAHIYFELKQINNEANFVSVLYGMPERTPRPLTGNK